ncbi:aminotransferase [Rhodospirillaceae bacterium SYSU D60014]|uniref:aminotransferase n=1 Tax=Virgifigura deserti TaxID=2268457 RepID=UPI000E66F8FC
MPLRPNPLLTAVAAPPIAEAQGWIAGRDFPADKPLIDLAQAVPDYPPPPVLTDHLARLVGDPATARYTEIEGIGPLRAALAADIGALYGAPIAPEQVIVTAGCNQAFCLAMMALAAPGDEVIVPLPYYFNHQMWLEMQGIRAVHLPFRAERGGVPDPEAAAALITPRTRAILLVTPNNPTGAVYPPPVLAAFHDLARRHDLALVVDETYRDFLPQDGAPHGLFAEPGWAETLVHLYSFSKTYCLTGYRVGAVVCGPRLGAEIAKAMDCVAICAPRIGQEAALRGLTALGAWRQENTALMRGRLAALREAFARNDLGYELVSAGAYFAYLRHPFSGETASDVARRLAAEQNLLCLPGSMFGPGQEDYLRFAFANVPAEAMPAVAARLAASLKRRSS